MSSIDKALDLLERFVVAVEKIAGHVEWVCEEQYNMNGQKYGEAVAVRVKE